jgi:phosphate transport system substrate-binding protein
LILEFGIWNLGFLVLELLILLVFFSGGMGCQRRQAGVTVAGSTSVEPFAELLAEEYMLHHPKSHIYVQGGGSTAGIEAVRSHAAHIGMSSRSLMAEEKNLYAVTIAKDAIAVIVHPENPTIDLPVPDPPGLRWKDQKLERNRRPSPSHCSGDARRRVGDKEAFQKMVMEKEEINLEALVQDSNGAIRQVVEATLMPLVTSRSGWSMRR